MIQDIFPHKLNNRYDPSAVPEPVDYVIHAQGNQILLNASGVLPKVGELGAYRYTYLFSVDDLRFFRPEDLQEIPDAFSWIDTYGLRSKTVLPKHLIFAALTAKHLADWYRDTRFCGRCGQPMEHSRRERAMTCPACRYTAYPRIMPACIIGVTNGDKLLLTKYRVGYGHNALVAGFTEIGETLEETVAREVMEEAGLRVKNIRYYKSQPWGTANDMLTGFYCDVDGDTEIHMDSSELKYAEWVQREEIELQPDDFSLTNEMMMMFKEGKNI